MLARFTADLRFALRMLRKHPLVTMLAVLCIALGSGAVASIYSVMNALVLQPLSGATDAAHLVRIERKAPHENDGTSASYPLYQYVAQRNRSLAALAAWSKGSFTIGRAGISGTTVYGNFVSLNFFSALGVHPLLGRLIGPAESSPVIVVSEGFWRTALGSDSGAVGRDVLVNGRRFTLVGVAPAAFRGVDDPIKTDAWMPLTMRSILDPASPPIESTSNLWLRLAGRMAPNGTQDVVHRELSAMVAAFHGEGTEPEWMAKYTDMRASSLTGLPPDASRPLAGFLGVLLGAAALVLLIASINVGALLSARAIARRREMAVRAALGAAPSRLVMLLLTEISLIFTGGALAGFALAFVATKALEHIPIPSEIAFAPVLTPDLRVFAFALAVSLGSGLLVGITSALRATRVDIARQLHEGAVAASAPRTLLGNTLVIGQLSASLVLLVGVGLFLRALEHARHIDPGFDARHVAAVPLDPTSWGYTDAKARRFFREMRQRVERLPGVTDVAYTGILPLTLRGSVDEMQVDARSDARIDMHYVLADAGYCATLHIPLIMGRDLARTDDERAPRVAIVNEAFARRFGSASSVLGETIRYRDARVTIVGVARDAKLESLDERVPPEVFFPLDQMSEIKRALLVRTDGDPHGLAAPIDAIVRDVDGTAPRPAVSSLERAMSIGLMPQRIAAGVTGTLGLLGLVLATVGLYGIIAYSTARRAREIGIRMALGARRSDVLRMVVHQGMRLTIVGAAVGVVLAAAASRVIASLLFGVSSFDALAYGAMCALLIGVAFIATWLPARRAAGISPMDALRIE